MDRKDLHERMKAVMAIDVNLPAEGEDVEAIVMKNTEEITGFDWDRQPVKIDNNTGAEFKEAFILTNLKGEILAVLTEDEVDPTKLMRGEYSELFFGQILHRKVHIFNIRYITKYVDISQPPYTITATHDFKNGLTNYQIRIMNATERLLNYHIPGILVASSNPQTFSTVLVDLMPGENTVHIIGGSFSAEFVLGSRMDRDERATQIICFTKDAITGEYTISYRGEEAVRFKAGDEISIGRDPNCDVRIDKNATQVDQVHAIIKVSGDEQVVTVNDVSTYGIQGQIKSVFLEGEFRIESEEDIALFRRTMNSIDDENPIMETIFQKGYTVNSGGSSSRNFPKQGDTIALIIRTVGKEEIDFGGLKQEEFMMVGEAVNQDGLLVGRFTWRVQTRLTPEQMRTVLRTEHPADDERQFDAMIRYCQTHHKHYWNPKGLAGSYDRLFHRTGEGQIRMTIYNHDSNAREEDIKRLLTLRDTAASYVDISNRFAPLTGGDRIEIDPTQFNPGAIIGLYERIKQEREQKERPARSLANVKKLPRSISGSQ